MGKKQTEFVHGLQYHVVQLIATPGLVLLLFAWLIIALSILLLVASLFSSGGGSSLASPATTTAMASPTMSELVLTAGIAFVIWYAMGWATHAGLAKIANYFEHSLAAYRWLVFAGSILGWGCIGLGILFFASSTIFAVGAVAAGAICLVSFGLQQILAKLWRVELV